MRLIRNSLYTLTSSVAPAIISIVTIPFFVTQIGSERYGVLSIAWLVLGYFGPVDFGIGRAITQRVAAIRASSDEGSCADAVWSALIGMAAFGALSATLLYLFARWYFAGPFETDESLRSEAVEAVWILSLCSIVMGLNGVLSGALMGCEKFGMVSISNAISNSALVIFPLATSYLHSTDLAALIASALFARALGAALLVSSVWREFFAGGHARFSRSEIKPLLSFGVWVMVSSLVSPVMLFMDRFMIGVFLGALAVAAYAIPYQIASRAMILPAALTQALYPRFAADEGAVAKQRCGEFAVFQGQSFALVTIVLVCLAEPLLKLWLGDLLDPRSVLVGQIIMIGFWANAIALIPYVYVQARGNPRFTAVLHIVELPIFLILLWVLGTNFGLAGLAIAFSVRCILDCVALMVKAGIFFSSETAKLAITVGLIVASFVADVLFDDIFALLTAALLLCAAAAAAMIYQMPPSLRDAVKGLPWARRATSALFP